MIVQGFIANAVANAVHRYAKIMSVMWCLLLLAMIKPVYVYWSVNTTHCPTACCSVSAKNCEKMCVSDSHKFVLQHVLSRTKILPA